LLGVVIAAVFGLHVLTVHHGDHGDLPTAVTAGSLSEPQDVVELSGMPAAVAGAMALGLDSPILPSDDGDGWLGGCILFLVVAGQGLSLLLMLIRRRISDPPMVEPGGGQVAVSWRPAAPAAPRSALGVLRI
jgi:hypothetical protein